MQMHMYMCIFINVCTYICTYLHTCACTYICMYIDSTLFKMNVLTNDDTDKEKIHTPNSVGE